MRIDVLDKFIWKFSKQARKIRSFLKYGEPQTRLTLFFAFAKLSEQYIAMSEECLKQGKSVEASFFSGKAETIRQLMIGVFGEAPERDYYKGGYKIPKDMVVENVNDLMEIAEFCVANMDVPEISDIEKLGAEIEKTIRKQKTFGIFGKFSDVLLKSKKGVEEPYKLATIYECSILLSNAEQTITALRELSAKQKTEKEKKELKGFKVRV
jgi:hypothetical protein